MKSFIAITLVLFSNLALAQDKVLALEAKILCHAKVLSVHCYKELYHQGHDWSAAGWVEVLTSQGNKVTMSMSVSRMEDEPAEAKKICKAMKALKASGKTDIIFTEEWGSNDENEGPRMDIKGGADLTALSPNYCD
jgi:hypothetical protein